MSTRTTLPEWCSAQIAAGQWSLSDCRMEQKKVKRSATIGDVKPEAEKKRRGRRKKSEIEAEQKEN